jgi:hypothetical protein
MAHRTSCWTAGLAAAAMVSLPFLAGAQIPPQQEQQHQPTHHQADDPQHHLQQARQALEGIDKDQLDGQARSQFEQLKEQFSQLERAYKDMDAAARTEMAEQAEWTRQYAKVDSTVTELLGPAREVVGTTGVTPATEVHIDPLVRSQLERFRQHLHQVIAAAEVGSVAAPGEPMTPAERTVTPAPTTPTTPTAPDAPAATPDRPTTQADRPEVTEPLTEGVTQPQAPAQRPGADQVDPARRVAEPMDPARQGDPEYHIERIRTLLDQAMHDVRDPAVTPDPDRPAPTTGVVAPGMVTVDRSTLEQIRNHVQQLEQILKDKDREGARE